MALVLALLELLTANAKILQLYLEGLTPEQRQAHANEIFIMLKGMHDGIDKVQGLLQRLHLGGDDTATDPAPAGFPTPNYPPPPPVA